MKTINEMIQEVEKKVGANSKDATVFKLMCISYRNHGKYTANDVLKAYKKIVDKQQKP